MFGCNNNIHLCELSCLFKYLTVRLRVQIITVTTSCVVLFSSEKHIKYCTKNIYRYITQTICVYIIFYKVLVYCCFDIEQLKAFILGMKSINKILKIV